MTITVEKGDITVLDVEAIVNAANSGLLGGGGVDGAIHRAAGPKLLEECAVIRRRQGGCDPGDAVITSAGNLHAKYVIHTVGPVWQGGISGEDSILERSYRSCLSIAEKMSITSIAFPNISTGVYGFPKERAADIVFRIINEYKEMKSCINRIVLVSFDEENYSIYKRKFTVANRS